MYKNQEYKNRINIQSICKYLRHGELPRKIEEGTLEERERRIYESIPESLIVFRDCVRMYDWTPICKDEKIKIAATEDMWQVVMDVISELSSFEYELGFRAGLTISSDIMDNDILTTTCLKKIR